MEILLLVFMIIWTIGGAILINKSTEAGGFDWIKSHLHISWMIYLSFTTVVVLIQPLVWRFVVNTNKQWDYWFCYPLFFVIGGCIFCGYFLFADKTAKSAQKVANMGNASLPPNEVLRAEQINKENEARREIRMALAKLNDEGAAILSHCEGINISNGRPMSPDIDPWKEFETWNIKARDYLQNEPKLGYGYQVKKENVADILPTISIPPLVILRGHKNIHTYKQLRARMNRLDEFSKEFPDVY